MPWPVGLIPALPLVNRHVNGVRPGMDEPSHHVGQLWFLVVEQPVAGPTDMQTVRQRVIFEAAQLPMMEVDCPTITCRGSRLADTAGSPAGGETDLFREPTCGCLLLQTRPGQRLAPLQWA